MNRSLSQFKRQTSRLVAIALCVWLSGALCVLNCNLTSVKAASTNETATSEASFDNLPPCHRQAAKRESQPENETSLESAPEFAPMLGCCGVFIATFEGAKSFQLAKVQLQKAAERFELPIPVAERRQFTFYSSYKPPPLARGSTFLRNCVFLI